MDKHFKRWRGRPETNITSIRSWAAAVPATQESNYILHNPWFLYYLQSCPPQHLLSWQVPGASELKLHTGYPLALQSLHTCVLKSSVLQKGFRSGTLGWMHSITSAFTLSLLEKCVPQGNAALLNTTGGVLEDGIGKISGIAFGWSMAECLIFSVTKQFVPCWVAHCQGNKYKFLKRNKIKRKNKHRATTCSANWQETCLRQWITGDRDEQLSRGALLESRPELFSDTLYEMLPSGRNPDWQLSERTIPAGHNTAKAEIIPLHNGTDSDCLQLLLSLGQLYKVCH